MCLAEKFHTCHVVLSQLFTHLFGNRQPTLRGRDSYLYTMRLPPRHPTQRRGECQASTHALTALLGSGALVGSSDALCPGSRVKKPREKVT